MRNFTQFTLKLLFVFLCMQSFQSMAVCPIVGSSDVCENQISAYSTTSNPGETYTWNVTGGGTILGTGNSINIAWTTAGTGTITLIVKDALNMVICTQTLLVTIHGKPNPVITPSFISGCGGRKGGSGQGDRDECIVACDSTHLSYSTPLHSGSTYSWTVTGTAIYSTSGNVLYVYWTGVGNGTVSVTETNVWGCSKETKICVEIVGKPTAAFTTLPGLTGFVVNACKNQVIQFIDQSVAGTGSPINSWSWYFGDGGTAFYNAPGIGNTSHAYTTPGTYTAMLVVENQCKCKDTAYVTVVVANSVGPEIFCISTVCPDATVTYSTNAQGCNNYLWTVTNGTIQGSNTDSTVTVLWGPNGPGSITLSVNCPGFCNAPTTVFVPIISPNATIQGPSQVCLNECYTYHISCDIPIDSIVWHFPPGATVTTDSINVHEVQVCYYGNITGNITVDYFHNTNGSVPPLNCGGNASLAVAVKPQMFMGGPDEICENQFYSYSIFPSPTGSIYWTATDVSGNTTYISNTIIGASPFAGVWTYGPGQFVITANDVSGNYCNGPLKKFLTVNPTPPVVDTLFGPSPVCPNNSYVYTAIPSSNNYTVAWQVSNGSPSTGYGNTLSITWAASGPYSISVVQIDPITGCKSAATSMTVNSALPLTPTPILGNDTVCANGNQNYSANATGDNFTWHINPSIAGSISSGQNSPNIVVQWNNYSGLAWLVVEREICGSSRKDSIQILVTGPQTPTITAPTTICQGVQLTATSSAAATYSWNFGDGGTSTSNPGTHVYNSPGNFVITLTVTYGGSCIGSASNTHTVSVLPKPDINISTPDPNLYCNPPISTTMTVALPPFGITYQWYNPSFISGANSPSYTAINTGSYYVVGTGTNGCKDTSNVIVVSTGNCDTCAVAAYSLTYNRFRLGCNTDSFEAVASSGVINFGWDFDDPFNPSTASGTPVLHTFTEPGYYRVKLCADAPNAAGTGYCRVCMYLVDTIKYVPDFYDSLYCTNNTDSVKVKFVNLTKKIFGYPNPSYSWLVNPGAYTSTNSNPTFNLAAGTYTVNLTVAGVCTFTKIIVIDTLTNASFTIQDSICQGSPVLFNNTSTGSSLSASWNFGDGASSLVFNPIRSYSNAGTYTTTLLVTNALGCTDTAMRTVVVLPHTLSGIINPGGPLKFCYGDSVLLLAVPSGGYPTYTYLWSNAQSTVSVWAKQTGNYFVEFIDAKGCFYKTGITNVLAKTSPTPTIIGPKDVCENNNYQYSVNYPNVPGAMFSWTLDGAPQFVNFNSLNIGTFSMSYGPHQLIVSIMSPDTCYGSDTFNFVNHQNPTVNIVGASALCAGQTNMFVANSTSPNLIGYFWSNGEVNDTIYTGVPNNYTVTVIDSFGCKADAFVVVHPLPDLCGLMTGCYDICDTVTQLVWYAPPGYAAYQWLYNGNPIPGANSDTIHIPLYQSGVYKVKIVSIYGCSITSDAIDINFIECGGCVFNGRIRINCGPVSAAGNQTYNVSFTINNSMGSGAIVNVYSPNGTVTSVSPPTLAAGMNTITAIFEDLPVTDTVVCFTISLSNNSQRCDTTMCFKLPPCGNKQCKLTAQITEFNCAGTDGSGNSQYSLCMNINWGGSNGSTLTLSTSSGSFVPNPVTINNGVQSMCFTYTDLPPANSLITIYLYGYDPVTGLVCKDSIRRDYNPCPKDSCTIGVYGLCAHCHEHEMGIWTYDVDLTVMNPFSGNATVSILPIAAGTFGPITPNPVAPGLQNITMEFTDLGPPNSIICFKVILTEVSSGRSCWQYVCLALPPCDSMTDILVNPIEEFSLSVYPNPASNFTTINYNFNSDAQGIEFVIRDVNGREIGRYNADAFSGEIGINTSEYSAGLYFIEIYKEGRAVGNTKLVIMQN